MLATRRNKRLGDLAAGTMVVHERAEAQPLLWGSSPQRATGLFAMPVALAPQEAALGDPLLGGSTTAPGRKNEAPALRLRSAAKPESRMDIAEAPVAAMTSAGFPPERVRRLPDIVDADI